MTLRSRLSRSGLAATALAIALLSGGPSGEFGGGRALAFGRTLDEIFRGSVRQENDGALPSYILNRGLPPVPVPKPLTPEQAAELGRNSGAGVLEYDLGQPLTWLEVVQQVAGGTPSPFAVDEVRRRGDTGDGQAVELLAWMHANGVGVRRDLPRAFSLYVEASSMGIEAARENAGAVFRSMNVEQRAQVKNPFN
ncbi:MAG: hypothetical protein VR70_13225 [Rhodospirillaceae bacterium BRH_c57]|nr:MAG: hypothetical protein VR70_13225 [Rhodospirillaceae bacterium BRH_c57]